MVRSTSSGHPGVAIPDIRVWRAVTSGCSHSGHPGVESGNIRV
ncbi:hypothetical protein PN604_04870 [Parabacteroides merdae]|nr:hypothetical protein [Parabacteroides merdae]MDB8920324.1 hypothetical protein [Parabacteroides merdae]